MSASRFAALLVAVLALAGCSDPSEPTAVPSSLQEVEALTAGVRDAAVQVSIGLQFAEGEPPRSLAFGSRYGSLAETVSNRRAPVRGGWLVGDDLVLVPDLQVHPRFLRHIRVEARDGAASSAHVVAYLRRGDGMILELHRRILGGRHLLFGPATGPLYEVHYGTDDTRWALSVRRTGHRFRVFDDGEPVADVSPNSLIVAKDGTPVGVCHSKELPLDGSWQGSPLDRPRISAEEYASLQQQFEARVRRGLPRVHLRLRSPKKDPKTEALYSWERDDDEDANDTDRDAVGVVVGPTRVLVLAELDATTTARLEEIEVHREDGSVVAAHHLFSLRDYGAFLAETVEPIEGAWTLCQVSLPKLMDALLFSVALTYRDARAISSFGHVRISALTRAWHGIVVPEFRGEAEDQFLCQPGGDLVAIPLLRRTYEKVRRWEEPEPEFMPMQEFSEVLERPHAHADLTNVPLPAEDERRLPWLGVELQLLDRELARANDVAHLTADGTEGALVSYVYSGSPAAEAGIQPGHILVRLHVAGRPKPVAVGGSGEVRKRYQRLLDRFDGIPESLRDRYPGALPWPSVENEFKKALISIGFGNTYTLEYVAEGVVRKQALQVVEGPPHFEGAPARQVAALGMTVKDLTYEVRRHNQLSDDAPGVIVAEVDRGRPAAVAGVRRYEIITKVNGKDVADAAAFASATAEGGDLHLTIQNGARERIAKLRLP